MNRILLALTGVLISGSLLLAQPASAETLTLVKPGLKLEMPSGWNIALKGSSLKFKAIGMKANISITTMPTAQVQARFEQLVELLRKRLTDGKLKKANSQKVKHFEATLQPIVGRIGAGKLIMVPAMIKTHGTHSIVVVYTGLRGKPGAESIKTFNRIIQSLAHVEPPKPRKRPGKAKAAK